jgi:hypothetical protein
MNVFVSYQRADTAMAAHALFYALRLEGHRAYIDTGDIGVGQLYVRGWLIPGGGSFPALTEAVNQLLIFSPVLVLPLLRAGSGAGRGAPAGRRRRVPRDDQLQRSCAGSRAATR